MHKCCIVKCRESRILAQSHLPNLSHLFQESAGASLPFCLAVHCCAQVNYKFNVHVKKNKRFP